MQQGQETFWVKVKEKAVRFVEPALGASRVIIHLIPGGSSYPSSSATASSTAVIPVVLKGEVESERLRNWPHFAWRVPIPLGMDFLPRLIQSHPNLSAVSSWKVQGEIEGRRHT